MVSVKKKYILILYSVGYTETPIASKSGCQPVPCCVVLRKKISDDRQTDRQRKRERERDKWERERERE